MCLVISLLGGQSELGDGGEMIGRNVRQRGCRLVCRLVVIAAALGEEVAVVQSERSAARD